MSEYHSAPLIRICGRLHSNTNQFLVLHHACSLLLLHIIIGSECHKPTYIQVLTFSYFLLITHSLPNTSSAIFRPNASEFSSGTTLQPVSPKTFILFTISPPFLIQFSFFLFLLFYLYHLSIFSSYLTFISLFFSFFDFYTAPGHFLCCTVCVR